MVNTSRLRSEQGPHTGTQGLGGEERLALERVAQELVGTARTVAIGRYELNEELGRGGCGAVYSAFDPKLDREVALKLVLRGRLSFDPLWEARLLREARALAKIRHRNVVEVFDVGVDKHHAKSGGVFVVMERLHGRTLGQWCRESEPSWTEIVRVYVQACRGLAAAHALGVVHRDLKPDNIMLTDGRVAKLIDFGLALEQDHDSTIEGSGVSSSGSRLVDITSTLTTAGLVMGTPVYMPPEQHSGRINAVGPMADQYALCVSLYESLYDERPFSGKTLEDLARSKTTGKVRAVDPELGIPSAVLKVISRGLRADPKERWPSVTQLADRLEAIVDGRGRRRRRLGLAIGVASVLGIGALTVSAAPGSDCRELGERRAEVWSPARTSDLERRLLARDELGARTWTRLRNRAQEDLDAWDDVVSAACEARDARSAQCFEGWLSEFETALAIIDESDAPRLLTAAEQAILVPPLRQCASGSTDAPLAHPQLGSAGVGPLHDDLVRAKALARSGQREDAVVLAAQTLAEARQLEDPSTLAHATYVAGFVRAENEEHDVAKVLLLESASTAKARGLDVLHLDVGLSLVRSYAATGDFEESRRWSHLTRATISRLGDATWMRKKWLTSSVFASIYAGEFGSAYDDAQELVALTSVRSHPAEHATALASVAMAAFELGRVHEATTVSAQAVELFERELGKQHPRLGRALADGGRYTAATGDVAEGVAMMTRAVRILEANNGPTDPYALNAKRTLSHYLSRLGRLDEAVEMAESAYEGLGALYGRRHVRSARSALDLADLYLRAERYEEGKALIRDAAVVLSELHGSQSAHVTSANELLVRAEVQAGELEAARSLARETFDVLDLSEPAQRETAINLTLSFAMIDYDSGDLPAAVRHLEEGVRLCKGDASSNDPSMIASFESMRAEIEAERGEPQRAVEAAASALALLEKIGAPPDEVEQMKAIIQADGQAAAQPAPEGSPPQTH